MASLSDSISRHARGLLHCAMEFPERAELLRGVDLSARPALEQIRLAIIKAHDASGETDEIALLDTDPSVDQSELILITNEGDGTAADIYHDRLSKALHIAEINATCARIQEASNNGDQEALKASLIRAGELAEVSNNQARIARLIADRAYREDVEPPEDTPILKVDGHLVLTAGNIGVIAGQSKAGKSAVIQSILASGIGGQGDNLKLHLVQHEGVIIHLDTEQSRADHYRLVDSAKRRAIVDKLPGYVFSLSLKGESPKAIREALRGLCSQLSKRGQSISIILIDGVADMAVDVNSIEESNELVRELEQLATEYETGILCVLHLNPGSEYKTRGHLGSQLERKAECNLRLEKKDGVTVIYSELNRRAAIPKEHGPRFEWHDGKGMHVSVASESDTKEQAKRDELAELARNVFDHAEAAGLGISHSKFKAAIMECEDVSDGTAKSRIRAILGFALVQKSKRTGDYFLTC